jgi:cytochrome b6-f complex iron-sulfur subunit
MPKIGRSRADPGVWILGSLTRREFLGYAWLTSLSALVIAGGWMAERFVRARFRPGEFGGRFNMGAVTALPPPGSAPTNEPIGRFWLIATPAGWLALDKACTHLDCLCTWDDQRREFVCPCHASRFAADGTYRGGPASRDLDRFVVEIVAPSGQVMAATDPASGAPVTLPADSPADSAVYELVVDTGRKVQGKPAL